jgi:hypothetical protein
MRRLNTSAAERIRFRNLLTPEGLVSFRLGAKDTDAETPAKYQV